MILEEYNDDRWTRSEFPLFGIYEERPKQKERCRKCTHSQWIYYHYNQSGYEDRYKTLICTAAKFTVCVNGFIKPEEFEQ